MPSGAYDTLLAFQSRSFSHASLARRVAGSNCTSDVGRAPAERARSCLRGWRGFGTEVAFVASTSLSLCFDDERRSLRDDTVPRWRRSVSTLGVRVERLDDAVIGSAAGRSFTERCRLWWWYSPSSRIGLSTSFEPLRSFLLLFRELSSACEGTTSHCSPIAVITSPTERAVPDGLRTSVYVSVSLRFVELDDLW